MMKRFLFATSILALTAGGAFAQGMTPGGIAPSAPGTATPGAAAPTPIAPVPGATGHAGGAVTGAASATAAARAPSTVKQAQTALKDKGLYQGHVDGKLGPATKAAIAKFQKQNGLRQTAQLDSRTMSELMGGASSGAGASGGIGGSTEGTGTMGGGATH
jgi:Putative peptidoglycan binding domain